MRFSGVEVVGKISAGTKDSIGVKRNLAMASWLLHLVPFSGSVQLNTGCWQNNPSEK